MEDETQKGFERIIADLEKEFIKLPNLKDCYVGLEYAKDYGNEDGIFKFKVYYKIDAKHPSVSYCPIILDPTKIDDYSSSPESDKKHLIEIIMQKIQQELSQATKKEKGE